MLGVSTGWGQTNGNTKDEIEKERKEGKECEGLYLELQQIIDLPDYSSYKYALVLCGDLPVSLALATAICTPWFGDPRDWQLASDSEVALTADGA